MIVINYGTSSHYEENVWDKYFCKNKRSAKKQLKELLELQEFNKESIKDGLYKFDWATTYQFCNTNIHIEEKEKEIFINVYEVDLI